MDDVTLRPIQEADLEHLQSYYTDPEAAGEFEWTGFRDPSVVQQRWDEDRWLGEQSGRLAVTHAGAFAGDVSFRDETLGVSRGCVYEIGIALLPQHRGRGVGTAAQRLLVDYLFDTTPAHRLVAHTEAENIAEQKALEKVGFEREGQFRQTHYRAGRWRDSFAYALLRDRP